MFAMRQEGSPEATGGPSPVAYQKHTRTIVPLPLACPPPSRPGDGRRYPDLDPAGQPVDRREPDQIQIAFLTARNLRKLIAIDTI